MSLYNELKRRNVFRVAIAYGVVAWLILQVTDVVLNNITAPPWVFWVILLVLGIGLVLVVVFSWAFEMTPEGLKRESEVDRSQSITTQTGKKLDRLIIGVLVLALAYFMVDKFVLAPSRDEALIQAALREQAATEAADRGAKESAKPAEDDVSIAVLPFVNMSDDASNEYFSDGISEEILNSLAQVKELKVAGRTSSFAFKGHSEDLRKIGEELGVKNILEGSVRKAGDKVRITAQLVKASDGFHLWSETYDRELTDVFAIQDDIATAVLEALKTTLLKGGTPLVKATRTDSKAYDLYLLAKQRMYERTEATLKSAADLLDRAVAIDPEYAPAYAQRGITALLLSEGTYGKVPHEQAMAQAKLYLDKALALDDKLAEAWAGMGLYYQGPPPQTNKAIEVLEKALAINPNLNDAANWLTLAYWQANRVADSKKLLDAISERDPMYRPAFGNRTFLLALMGKFDEARAFVDRIEPFMPGDPQVANNRAWIDYEEGKAAEALKLDQSALAQQPTDRVYKVGVNEGYYLTHQYDQVVDDHWSNYHVTALFNLGRNEEALIEAQKFAANGVVGRLFWLLNATDQSDKLIEFLEQRWPDLESFQRDVPPSMWGYGEMADIALAYRRAGNQQRFEEAMARLDAASQSSLGQGIKGSGLLILIAAYHAMAGETDQALAWLGKAIDGGLITSTRISKEYPFFRDLEGMPEYQAIQSRMLDHLNREREELGLEPVSA